VATSAREVDEDDAPGRVSSAMARSFQTSWKVGKGFWRVRMVRIMVKSSLRPCRTWSARVRSLTGHPRSCRPSAMFFIC
jgi:hypothetical protein